jgi:hypothetical protein
MFMTVTVVQTTSQFCFWSFGSSLGLVFVFPMLCDWWLFDEI